MENSERKCLCGAITGDLSASSLAGATTDTPAPEERLQAVEAQAQVAFRLLGEVANRLDALRLAIVKAVP